MASADLPKSVVEGFFARLVILIVIAWHGLAAALVAISFLPNWIPLRILLLFSGTAILFRSGAIACLRVVGQRIPARDIQHFYIIYSFLLALFFHGFPGSSLRWLFVVVLGFLAFVAVTALGIIRYMTRVAFPKRLLHDFDIGDRSDFSAIVYVMADSYIEFRLARSLARAVQAALDRQFCVFLYSRDFRGSPQPLRSWIVRNVPAIMVIRDTKRPPEWSDCVAALASETAGHVFAVLMNQSFSEKARETLLSGVDVHDITGLRQFEQEEPTKVASAIAWRLQHSAFRSSEANKELPDHLYKIQEDLAFGGLRPIASCLLRFRLAQSDVERVLALMEGIEAVARCNVLIVLSSIWEEDRRSAATFCARLKRPTLGVWVGMLRSLLEEQAPGAFARSRLAFWRGKCDASAMLEAASMVGLERPGAIPGTYLTWLEWFVWLRNNTRGHGAVVEDRAAVLWSSMYPVFLTCAGSLQGLLLRPIDAPNQEIQVFLELAGWNRKVPAFGEETRLAMDTLRRIELQYGETTNGRPFVVRLFPFIVECGGSILLWNKCANNGVEYMDFGTGRTSRCELPSSSPLDLWVSSTSDLM